MISIFRVFMEYIYQLILLVKRWSSYIGLANKRNFEDTFYQLLHDKNYDEALRLAQQHDYLDIDLVYKCKWRNSGITIQSINSVLGKIQDKLWAINECAQTVPISYEACRRLIEFGLTEANLKLLYELGDETPVGQLDDNKYGNKSSRLKTHKTKKKRPLLDDDTTDEAIEGLIDFDNLNDQQKELCRCRQNLLRHEHSLLAYESILGDYKTIQQDFDHVFYDEFRQKCPLNLCIDYAHEGDSHAVEICLNFYTEELSCHILAILSNFPETLSPYQYRNLLPCLRGNQTTFEWQTNAGQIKKDEQDWSRRDKTSSIPTFLKTKAQVYEEEFYKDENEPLKKYLQPLTSQLLTEWFIERALVMESRTLLLSGAIQLLHLGTELNIKNLQDTHDDLNEFDRIIYDCCTESNIYLSFTEFNKMPELDRLILMTGDSLKNCKDKFRFYVIPYLHRRKAKLKLEGKIRLLGEYFTRLAHTREQICRAIYDDLLDCIGSDRSISTVRDWTEGMDDEIDAIGDKIKTIERERQAKQFSTIASQTFALGDYNACYDTCHLIMKKNFKECWPLCCQLGMHKQFNNLEAKYRLLAFALAHCDDSDGKMSAKILEYVIELRKRDEKIQLEYLKRNM